MFLVGLALAVTLTGCDVVVGALEDGVRGTIADARQTAPGSGVQPLREADAAQVLAGLPVRGADDRPASRYDREAQFGDGWADLDGDGCDTRNEILAADLDEVERATDDDCTVAFGLLHDPYTLRVVTHASGPQPAGDPFRGVQIDHVVALSDAWASGADRLSQRERLALANDPANLLAVSGPANQSKSDRSADAWSPENADYACALTARQVGVKDAYGLSVTRAEKRAMAETLAQCPGHRTPDEDDRAWFGGTQRPDDGAFRQRGQEPSAGPDSAAGSGEDEDEEALTCAQVWDRLDRPAREGQDEEYRAKSDGDGDGESCERDPR